jgi:putative transposase
VVSTLKGRGYIGEKVEATLVGTNVESTYMIKCKTNELMRLDNFPYQGCYRYFITLRCHSGKRHFVDNSLISTALKILRQIAEQRNFYIWAYCFMPDHLHLLIEGKTENADMRKFISVFKQKAAFWFNSRYNTKLWQPRYYDHVLRKDEVPLIVVRYIFENPVRKGIVTDYLQYPYSGSFELNDISQLFV